MATRMQNLAPIDYMSVYGDQSSNRFMNAFQSGALAKQAVQAIEQETAAQELKKQYEVDLRNAIEKPNAKTFAELTLKYPSQREAFSQSWKTLSKDQQDNEFLIGSKAFVALNNGNVDAAKEIVSQQITAAENSGQPTDKYKAMLTTLDSDPKIVQSQLGLILSNVDPEKWSGIAKESRESTLFPILQKQKMAELSKAGSEAQKAGIEAKYADKFAILDLEKKAVDLGLTKQQTNKVIAENKKLGLESAKAVMELEALEKSGGLDPTKKFDFEKKLRDEFITRTKDYNEMGVTIDKIKSSAQSNTGPGDVALITGFMKMLDPGSVVRETEFATARDTAGLVERLQNNLNKARSGQFLQTTQRKEFVALAQQYYDAAKKKADKDKQALNTVVKNYKLTPENVFGPEATDPTQETNVETVTVQGTQYTRPPNYSDIQWNAYKKAMGVQ